MKTSEFLGAVWAVTLVALNAILVVRLFGFASAMVDLPPQATILQETFVPIIVMFVLTCLLYLLPNFFEFVRRRRGWEDFMEEPTGMQVMFIGVGIITVDCIAWSLEYYGLIPTGAVPKSVSTIAEITAVVLLVAAAFIIILRERQDDGELDSD